MTTTTITRKRRAARPAPARSGIMAALADIPRERLVAYLIALAFELLILSGMGVL